MSQISSFYDQLGPGAKPQHFVVRAGGFQEKPIRVEGIIGPGFQSTGWRGNYITNHFELSAWRKVGTESLIQIPLAITRLVPSKAVDKTLPTDAIVELDLILNIKETRALMRSGSLMETPKPELQAFAIAQSQPIIFHSPKFGPLTLDKAFHTFETAADWLGEPVTLIFEVEALKEMVELDKAVTRIWEQQSQWQSQFDAFVIPRLVDLKNMSWLDEDETGNLEAEISEADMQKALTFTEISFSADQAFTVRCGVGDLFFGHGVEVNGRLESGPTHVGLFG